MGGVFLWRTFPSRRFAQPRRIEANIECDSHLQQAGLGVAIWLNLTADEIEHVSSPAARSSVVRVQTGPDVKVDKGSGQADARCIRSFGCFGGCSMSASARSCCPANPCAGVEFPVRVKGLFRPHYMTWSEQQMIEFHAPDYLRNVIRIITETGLRVYKELAPMRKEHVDLENAIVWIPDSKTPNGVAEVPLTEIAVEAFRGQMRLQAQDRTCFPSDENPNQGIRPLQEGLGTRLCSVPGCRTFGSTISVPRTPPGSAPGASRTNGSRRCSARATRRFSRSTRR